MKEQNKPIDDSCHDGIFYAPWEKTFNRILTPFEEFIHRQATSGILLMIMAMLAMVLANSGLAEFYHQLIETHISIDVGSWEMEKTVHHWVNDGLMTLFFFVVGLELKREVLVGELADVRKATLPIAAAIGGMAAPALIYYFINPEGVASGGWGMPMATDIAFALGALALISHRVPKALITFLVALAIVDDLGAVTVIAIFYTENISLDALAFAGGLFGLLIVFNRGGIRSFTPYFIVSVLLWYMLMQSGVHATLAGVLAAFSIPAIPKYNPMVFNERVKYLMKRFESSHEHDKSIMNNAELRAIVCSLESSAQSVQTLSQRLEHTWHMPVAYIIIPFFILANAGTQLELSSLSETLAHPVALGVSLGLIVGKFAGITGVSWLLLRFGFARLPSGVRFTQIAGVSLLAGIGFTMSMFIAELAFEHQENLLLISKTGLMFASLIAGVAGSVWLFVVSKQNEVSDDCGVEHADTTNYQVQSFL
ncbi:Na(+)/H(+) antiporter [Candidatus Scalindua japonica]|uniref:Na(+)/H(+) antiporter NhaA n=1 Tax=Candidatus Scalindua japonica TaxID=1284222 RepID=A0A286TTK4_9BACT|nr:Na+/H+ antiporter NhaA [Candidatus Scalindua japonica]GAX59239.1 Na(+)/H(+) antiporter [Candidatus Scalindua japonica]